MDKLHHFIWTSWLVFVLGISGDLLLAFFFAMVGACIKETYDAYQPNNVWDWWDLLAGLGGAMFSILILKGV